jgi:hypothetical protein
MDQDQQHEFTIHEFDALRREIDGYFVEMRKLEVYAVLAIGVFYSFLIQLERPQQGAGQYDLPVLTWALPIIFPLLAVIRASAFDRQIKLIAEYLNKVEARYGRTPLGWEHFMEAARENKRTTLGRTSYLFAAVLGLVTVGVFAWRVLRKSGVLGDVVRYFV